MKPDELWTLVTVSSELGIGVRQIQKLVASGKLRAYKPKGTMNYLLFLPQDVLKLKVEREENPPKVGRPPSERR